MKWLEKRIMKRIYDDVYVNLKVIDNRDFDIGQSLYNYKCHLNSVNTVKLGEATKVFLCLAVNRSNEVVVHFINQKENGRYIDNTWGFFGIQEFDYYIVKEIVPLEFNNVGDILYQTQQHYIKKHSNFITRKLSKIGI